MEENESVDREGHEIEIEDLGKRKEERGTAQFEVPEPRIVVISRQHDQIQYLSMPLQYHMGDMKHHDGVDCQVRRIVIIDPRQHGHVDYHDCIS